MNEVSKFFLVKMLVASVFFIGSMPFFAGAQQVTFFRSLKIGSVGEDVRQLQKILNSSPETAIRSVGAGSPGQETMYFGALTRDAVVRFQEKYRSEVLTPNGLTSGTGFVGPSTIAKLNQAVKNNTTPYSVINPTSDVSIYTNLNSTTTSLDQKSTPTPLSSVVIDPTNPNTKDLDLVLEAIDRVGIQQGYSQEQLQLAKQVVIKEAATTTNLNDKFIETVRSSISNAPEPVRNIFADLAKPFAGTFFAKKAEAAVGFPFGGRLLFSMFCTNSGNWWIGVQPLSPTYATLLTYQTGTQIHLGYNIPKTSQLLGKYGPGAPCIQGVCPYCVTMPYQGMIYPSTGSSAI